MITQSQLDDFFSYLRFPSISADPQRGEAMTGCADWLVRKFHQLGFAAGAHRAGGPPVVLARSSFSRAKKTVLIYGHYDVQPVDPLALWQRDPFDPYVAGDKVVARGATDNKGQTLSHLLGAEAALRVCGGAGLRCDCGF
jgi:acetylornithine deacetylase/succinyl-diaminopimelate desuccinylase-like protein